MRRATRLLLAWSCALVGSLAVVPGGPASAVQTTTWGIVAAPEGSGYRASIAHAADGRTIHDAVIVFNRSDRPITVHLYVLDARQVNGGYQFDSPTAGLARNVELGAGYVHLAGHQQARVAVTIHMPRGLKSEELAGIGAEAAPVQDGALSIMQQLVVLVKATPPSGQLLGSPVRDLFPWALVSMGALLGVGTLAEWERRRKKPPVGAAGALLGSPVASRGGV